MSPCFLRLAKSLGLVAILAIAVAFATTPAMAGTINSPLQVTFNQNNSFGMGNFNGGNSGGLFAPNGGLEQNDFFFTDGNDSDNGIPPVSAPEPATWVLLAAGLLALGLVARRRPAPADAAA